MATETKHQADYDRTREARRTNALSPASQRAHLDVQSVSETDNLRAIYEAPEGRTRAEHAGYLNGFNQSARDLYERGAGVYGDVLIIPREASGQAQGADEIRLGTTEHAVKNFSRFIRDTQELGEKASEFVHLGKQIAGRTADGRTRLVVFREFSDRVTKNADGKYRTPQDQRASLDETLAEMRSLAAAMREQEWTNDRHIQFEEISSWERNLAAHQRDAESETHGWLAGHIEGQDARTEEEREHAEVERERSGSAMSGEHDAVRLDRLPPVLPEGISATEREKLFAETLPRIDGLLERGVAPRSLIQALNRQYREEETQGRDEAVARRLHGYSNGAVAERAVTRQEQLRALLTVRTLADVAHRKEESRFSQQAWQAMREYYAASSQTRTTLHERASQRRNPYGSLSEPPALTAARLEVIGATTPSTNSPQVRGGASNFASLNLTNSVPRRADVERLEALRQAIAYVDAEVNRRGFSIQERMTLQQAIELRLASGSHSEVPGREVYTSLSTNTRARLPIETFNEYKVFTTTAEHLRLPFHTYDGSSQEEMTGNSAEREQLYSYQKEYIRYRMQDEETRMLNQHPLYRDFARRLNEARNFDELRAVANEIRRENHDRERNPNQYLRDKEAAARDWEPVKRPLTEQQMRSLFLTPAPAHYTDEMRRYRLDKSISGQEREHRIRQLERHQHEPSPALTGLLGEFERTRSANRAQHTRNINLFIADLINPPRPDRHRFSRLDLHAEHARLAPDERNFLFRIITDTKNGLKTDAPLHVRERVLQIERGRDPQPSFEPQLRVPADSRSFRRYTGAAAWREAELLTEASQRFNDTRDSRSVERQSIIKAIPDRDLETVVTLLHNFKSNQLLASAEYLRSSETCALRQVGEVVSTFKDMTRTTNARDQFQYQITIPENSELTREDWRQLLDHLQPQLTEAKTNIREILPAARAQEMRQLALTESWDVLDPAHHQRLGQTPDAPAATLEFAGDVRREVDRARELQKRVAVAHDAQEQVLSADTLKGAHAARSAISHQEQNKVHLLRAYTRQVKGEYLAAFPRIDEATRNLERTHADHLEARESRHVQERSELFTEVRGSLEQRVGDYLKTVLREHGEAAFEQGRGGTHHTQMVGKIVKEAFSERGATLESMNLNEDHIKRAARNIVGELSRALQPNRERDMLLNEVHVAHAGANRDAALRSDDEHDFTHRESHVKAIEKRGMDVSDRAYRVEETRKQPPSTHDLDDEFVEQKIGAHVDRVHQDVFSHSSSRFANPRTSQSHQPAREHTASQEHVRQYTLTR